MLINKTKYLSKVLTASVQFLAATLTGNIH